MTAVSFGSVSFRRKSFDRPHQLVNVMSKSALSSKTHASQNFPRLELCFDSYRFLVCIVINDVRVVLVGLDCQASKVPMSLTVYKAQPLAIRS